LKANELHAYSLQSQKLSSGSSIKKVVAQLKIGA